MKNKIYGKNSKSNRRSSQKPIGVFDSGLGGLTVVRELRRRLPQESIIYFGDIARLPYGIKSREQILTFSIQNTLFLLKKKIKALVIACNSSSSAAYQFLKNHFNLPIVDVIFPAAEAAARATRKGRVGVIATQATIASGSYEKALKRLRPGIQVFSYSCPLFVPLVEEGWLEDPITDDIIRRYLKPFQKHKIDTLILGCTHYPLLKSRIEKIVGKKIRIVDSTYPTVTKLASLLDKNKLRHSSVTRGKLKIFVSDLPRNFLPIGERFLGEKLSSVEVVRQK
jgi:glutamate racemase